MSIKSFAILTGKCIAIALLYAIVLYKQSTLATISFYCCGVILLMSNTTAGLAMLMGGIAGMAGELIRGDYSLLMNGFILVAILSFSNCILAQKGVNSYFRAVLISILNLIIVLAQIIISNGVNVAFAVLNIKLIECILVIIISFLAIFIISKLENR